MRLRSFLRSPLDLALCLILGLLVVPASGCRLYPTHSAYRPIHELVRSDDETAIQSLLADHPEALRQKDDAGLTPLHIAALQCNSHLVGLLIRSGAELEARDRANGTPLHLAAQHGCADIVVQLLNSGASLNPRDKHGWTPLKRSILWHQEHTTKLLRDRGALE